MIMIDQKFNSEAAQYLLPAGSSWLVGGWSSGSQANEDWSLEVGEIARDGWWEERRDQRAGSFCSAGRRGLQGETRSFWLVATGNA
jgi:hypothetical protein